MQVLTNARKWFKNVTRSQATTVSRNKKVRLALEQLDERLMPAITFASFDTGTWAFNHDNDGWRQITTAQASVMDEGADGTLFANYSTGTWEYDGGWNRITTAQANEMA